MEPLTQQTRVSFRLKAMMWEGRRWQTWKGCSHVNTAGGEGPLILLLELFRSAVFSSSLHLSNSSSPFLHPFKHPTGSALTPSPSLANSMGPDLTSSKRSSCSRSFDAFLGLFGHGERFPRNSPKNIPPRCAHVRARKASCFVPWQDADSEPATQTIDYSSDRDLYLYTGFSCCGVCDIPLISCLPQH